MLPDSTVIAVVLSIFFPASVPSALPSQAAEQPEAVTNTTSRTGNQTEGNMSWASVLEGNISGTIVPQFKSS